MLDGDTRHHHSALADGEGESVDIAGLEVERGRGGEDDSASLGEGGHITQMDKRIGGLAHDEDQAAALLEHDIGSALDKALRHAGGDASHAAHGGGDDEHGIPACRATGQRRPHIIVIVALEARIIGEGDALGSDDIGTMAAHDKGDTLHSSTGEEQLEALASIDGTTGTRNGDDNIHNIYRYRCSLKALISYTAGPSRAQHAGVPAGHSSCYGTT